MLIAHYAMQLNHHTRVTRVMCYTCNILQSLPGIVLLPPGGPGTVHGLYPGSVLAPPAW